MFFLFLTSYCENDIIKTDDLRTRKNDTVYTYLDGKLLREVGPDGVIDFIYGVDGIMGISYKNAVYLFRKNVFGDVTHIYDTEGNLKAYYIYDAWGYHKVVNVDEDDPIGEINPIRYRSYYYDTETGLYYLRTRYYDPDTGRFISQDSISYLNPEHLSGLNLYAYCNNNPVMNADANGHAWYNVLGWIGVGLVVAAAVVLTCGAAGVAIGGAGLAGAVIHGAAVGVMIGAGAGAALGAASGAIYSGVTGADLGSSVWAGVQAGFGIGAIAGAAIGGAVGGISFTPTQTATINSSDAMIKNALQELNKSGLRPGQTEIHKGRILEIYNNFDPIKAQSSIYTTGNTKFIVDGHHTTVASWMRGSGTTVNMGGVSPMPPSVQNVYWTKKWYEFWKVVIKLLP